MINIPKDVSNEDDFERGFCLCVVSVMDLLKQIALADDLTTINGVQHTQSLLLGLSAVFGLDMERCLLDEDWKDPKNKALIMRCNAQVKERMGLKPGDEVDLT